MEVPAIQELFAEAGGCGYCQPGGNIEQAVRRKTKRPARTLRRTDQVPSEARSSRPQHPKRRGDGKVGCGLFPTGPPSAGESAQALAVVYARPDGKEHQPLASDVDEVQQSLAARLATSSPAGARR